MRNARNLLASFTLTLLSSSCAFGYGQRRCEPVELPPRPVTIVCISNGSGVGQCFDPITQKNEVRSMENHVCMSARDHMSMEEWIKTITEVR